MSNSDKQKKMLGGELNTSRRKPRTTSEVPAPNCAVQTALHIQTTTSLPTMTGALPEGSRHSSVVNSATTPKLTAEGTLRRRGSVRRPPEYVTRNRNRAQSGPPQPLRLNSPIVPHKSAPSPKSLLPPKDRSSPTTTGGNQKAPSVHSKAGSKVGSKAGSKASSINSGLQRENTTDSDLSDVSSLRSYGPSDHDRIGTVFGVGAKRKYGVQRTPEEENEWKRIKEVSLFHSGPSLD